MNKASTQLSIRYKSLAIALIGVLFSCNVVAQTLATYVLKSGSANPPAGTASPAPATSPNVVAGAIAQGANMTYTINSTGYRVKTDGSNWPGGPTNGYSFDIPLKPVTGNDMNMTGISLDVTYADFDVTGSTMSIVPYFQVDGAGPWLPLTGTQVTGTTGYTGTLNFGPFSETFYSGHSYVIRFYTWSSDATKDGHNDELRIANLIFKGTTYQPPAQAVTVSTDNAAATGRSTASVTGTYTYDNVNPNKYYLVKSSGVIYSTNAAAINTLDTSAATKVYAGSAGNITDNLTGLAAGTTYYAKTYIVTQFGIQYGSVKSFTTDAPVAPFPAITINQVFSYKASATATVPDDGGSPVTERYFVWSTNPNPTISNSKLYAATGTAAFTDLIKGLAANTTYHVRVYAKNAIGSSYSKDTAITTGPPVPALTATPSSIDFGTEYYQNTAITLSYTLKGTNLTGAPINITAPAGFVIATSTAGLGTASPGNTISITTTNPNYSGSTLSPTLIYVQMSTLQYNTYSNSKIINAGGGAAPADADTVTVTGSIAQTPIDVSNTGTDYWLGFGFEQKMQSKTSPYPPFSGNGANLYVYISGTPNTQVTVEMPYLSTPFSQTVTINAQGFAQVTGFPQGDQNDPANAAKLPDARLYYTGISNRAIHVYSHGAPISVWMYDYATNNSAGGSLVFPTNTWNSNYTVQAYGNNSNTGPPNSFFFVIANQDNTPVYFTPSVNIIDSTTSATFTDDAATDVAGKIAYQAGTTYTIYLNKGQVFNALSGLNGSLVGQDLSGTIVRTDCDKKIAVFAGNGRCLVSTPATCTAPGSGSDNMIQQMVPSVAWDTKYFTVPTKSMARNLYRIYVRNTATQVWINDTTHTQANNLLTTAKTTLPVLAQVSNTTGKYTFTSFANGNGGYYSIESSAPMEIESDQPINITQFITSCSGNNSVGNNGGGDPEMIILTGAQQAITNATVYSPMIQDGQSGGAYINIVIPKDGVSTFKLDNLNTVDTGSNNFTGTAYGSMTAVSYANAFKPYPSNPNYYYATFHVGNATSGAVHTMSSSVPFNGIAYGVAGGESYGFNAGTQVKNLSSIQFTDNPNGRDSSATAVRTCVDNPVSLKIALPFNPSLVDSLVWNTQGDARITPLNGITSPQKGTISGGKAKYDSTFKVNGRDFYVYTSPTKYTFDQLGTYRLPVTAYGTFASDCPGQDIENMLIIVGKDQANLSLQANCGNPTVILNADTIPMAGANIIKTIFDFGDNSTPQINGPVKNVSHTYPASQIYTAKFTSYNTVGCISTDSVEVDFSGGLQAAYTTSTNAICAGGSITFTDASVASGVSGSPNKWIWDFGDNTKDSTSGTTVTHTYATAGKYPTTLTVRTTAGCVDQTSPADTVFIQATPIAAFSAVDVCAGNTTTFTNLSSVPNNLGIIDSVFWDFGDGNKLNTTSTSTFTHSYAQPGKYTVTLSVKSDGGCSSATPATHDVNVFDLPVAGFKIDVNCVTNIITFTDTSNAKGGTITEWDWDFGDGAKLTTNNDSVIHHYYANGNGQTFTVNLTIKTQAGCSDDATPQSFSIGAAPVAQFSIAPGTYCLPNASVSFNNTSSISDGSTNNMSYIWNFGDVPAPGGDSVVAQGPPAAAAHIFTTQGPYTVTLTAVSNKGCTNSASVVVDGTIIHQPPVAGKFNPEPSLCFKDSLSLTRTFTGITISQYSWNMGDGTDLTGPTVKYAWKNPGVYPVTFVATSTDGCQSVPVVDSVTVNELPVAGFTAQATGLCPQTPVSFTDASTTQTGSAITQWFWNFGDGASQTVNAPNSGSVTHTYAASGTYSVSLSVKNSNGCSSTTYIGSVTINPLPYPNFTVTPICVPGADAQFTDKTTIASGAVIEWAWDFGDNTQSTQQNPTHPYPIGGTYPVKLNVTSALGCVHDTTISVTAYDTPTALDSIVNKGMLCSSAPVVLLNQSFVSGPNGNVSRIELFWDAANNSTTPDVTDNAPVANGRYTHDYGSFATDRNYTVTLKAYSGNGCPTTPYSQDITVLASPDARFDALAPVCQETTPFALSGGYDANNLGGTGAYSGLGVAQTDSVTYTFDPQVAGPGLDSPIVFTANYKGCTDTAQQAIFVYPTPSLDYGGVQSILEGDSATLNPVKVEGIGLSFNWDPSLYLDNDTIPTPLAKPIDDITYTITASSPAGCHGSTTLLVQVLKDFIVANTFTPNGDGVNDTWVIKELPKYPIHRVQVFNRYGQILMETHGYTKPWDGTMNGSQLPAGTYYYIIELNGLRTPKTGYVTILR
ncbi:gliding motility-associated C-terminal domain-containing protein [Ferruginibacter albus]|uniref:gliding motility-associated C-terminal domain-containing protein n=1 Tax=Ferruginibacter albus TaxID=2875540 RepID=UPI001CC62922|nr:gliding motility-associated C-terminal domain-containing protein [Ferruginibacter albus]UAY53649.1 PKD domain-containing protein [Ferruginibacter albus]